MIHQDTDPRKGGDNPRYFHIAGICEENSKKVADSFIDFMLRMESYEIAILCDKYEKRERENGRT